MRANLRRWLLGGDPVPEYAAVGLNAPQQQVEVWLEGGKRPLDVTRNHSVAALRPLTLACCLSPDLLHAETAFGPISAGRYSRLRLPLTLAFRERSDNGALLGRIRLRLQKTIPLGDKQLCLFAVTGYENHCLSRPRLYAHYLYRAWQRRRTGRALHNFEMRPGDLHALYVYYFCPRPVVLVSVAHANASNLFPMDLIGPTASGHFLMALRNTTPAVQLMEQSRQMALCDIPAAYAPIAYALGKHHRKQRIDLSALPFETMPSPLYGLPVTRAALAVREVQVEQTYPIGSHTLFVTRERSRQTFASGPQMFHVQGFYQRYLAERGRRL